MDIKGGLESAIKEVVRELFSIDINLGKSSVENPNEKAISGIVSFPKLLKFGDYQTVVALGITNIGRDQEEIAKKIVDKIKQKSVADFFSEIKVESNGIINFFLKREGLLQKINTVLQEKENWGKTDLYKDQKILVEHSSPNLFKPFHIGHLMNNTIGESIARLAKWSGAQVTTLSFPSDISLGVAKAIYVLLETYGADFTPTDVAVLGDAYVAGVKRYDEDEGTHARIKEIADNLYTGTESPEWTVFQVCKAFNIRYFEHVVANLGSHFDAYIYESEAGVEGKDLVLAHISDELFREGDGKAIVYTSPEGNRLHTAVFLNGQGNPTYEAKDLGLLKLKFERYTPDLSIFVTDMQQVSHFLVVLDAARHIEAKWADKSLHRYHGRMSFKGQKMSSRLGGVPLVEDILAAVAEEVKQKNPDVTDESARMIGIAAIKFAILRSKAGMNIDFDPDESLSFEGSSGPYLQYTAVRAMSLLAKGNAAGIDPDATHPVAGTETLERLVARFPEIVAGAQREWAPHHLVTYLLELAQGFNSWYGQGKIIDDDTAATSYRLATVAATRQTLVNGLWLLGIEVPEKM